MNVRIFCNLENAIFKTQRLIYLLHKKINFHGNMFQKLAFFYVYFVLICKNLIKIFIYAFYFGLNMSTMYV